MLKLLTKNSLLFLGRSNSLRDIMFLKDANLIEVSL